MNVNVSEVIYVFDGLFYYGSDFVIEIYYVDIGGVSDMSFVFCYFVGF